MISGVCTELDSLPAPFANLPFSHEPEFSEAHSCIPLIGLSNKACNNVYDGFKAVTLKYRQCVPGHLRIPIIECYENRPFGSGRFSFNHACQSEVCIGE